MAPSNLSQVFFSNTTDASIQTAAGTVFADLTGTASAVERRRIGFEDCRSCGPCAHHPSGGGCRSTDCRWRCRSSRDGSQTTSAFHKRG